MAAASGELSDLRRNWSAVVEARAATAEVTGLREQFQAGGVERLASVIAQRSTQPGSSLYLLVDTAGRVDRFRRKYQGETAKA